MRYSDGAAPRMDSDGSLLLDTGLGPNSQCRISGPLTLPATSAGTDLTIHPHCTLQGALAAGPQKVYFLVTDLAQRNTGWMQGSTWTP